MNREEFEKVFDNEDTNWDGDNTFQGLVIIAKYIDIKENDIIAGVEHDILYSVDVDDIVDNGITLEDAIKLRKLNWMIEEDFDCLACFV